MTEEKEKKEVEEETPTEEKGRKESPKEKAVKEPPKEEKKEEPSKDKEKKQPPKDIAFEAAAPEGKVKKRKKINRMKLEEIEKRLGELQGMSSLYAQHLLERQKELQAPKEASLD